MDIEYRAASPMMLDYLRHLFRSGDAGPVRVDGHTDVGRLMIAHVRSSGSRPPSLSGGNVVILDIGLSDLTRSLSGKWLYYQEGDIRRINAGIQAWFSIDLYTFWMKAEGLGFSRKEIIEAFITSRGLSGIDPYDALHKRVYRREQDKRRNVAVILARRISYLMESVNMGGLAK